MGWMSDPHTMAPLAKPGLERLILEPDIETPVLPLMDIALEVKDTLKPAETITLP